MFHALLQIAQIETGSPKAGFRAVDLSELCTTFCELYEPAAIDAGHALSFHPPGGSGIQVVGDRGLLGQVLANLIENTLRHTPPGTQVAIGLSATDGRVVMSVSDNGPGVPEAERDLVLRRLYRMDRSRTSPGAGLGLSLVNSIAMLHGAEVRLLDNQPGLRVELVFPAMNRPAVSGRRHEPFQPRAGDPG